MREKIVITKEYSNCTCTFEHDLSRKVLCIHMYKSGRKFFTSTISNITKRLAKPLIKTFNEENIREMVLNNIFIL
jgi:hypothetical protein